MSDLPARPDDGRYGWIVEHTYEYYASRRRGSVIHADRDCPALTRTKHGRIVGAYEHETRLFPACQRCS